MTVPGPRFRDQLAEALEGHHATIMGAHGRMTWLDCSCGWETVITSATGRLAGARQRWREHLADTLLPLIAAEVEAARQDGIETGRGDLEALERRWQEGADQREANNLIRLADAWDENASRWYYENRHTHPNGIGWVGGYEEGWCEGARLLRDRAAALAQPAPGSDT